MESVIKKIRKEEFLKEFKNEKQISIIELEDVELQEALYRILKGSSSDKKKGYPSFLDYIVFSENSKQTISVYLAKVEMLQVIYPNKSVVDEILSKRELLYLAVKQKSVGGGISKEEASEEFKRLFGKGQYATKIDPSKLSFKVSSTKPLK